MQVRKVFSVLIGAAFLCGASAAYALDSDEFTKDESKCQDAVSKSLGLFTKKKAGCVVKCLKKNGHVAECQAPYSSDTAACIQKAESKAEDKMDKKCVLAETQKGKDACPECYDDPGNPGNGGDPVLGCDPFIAADLALVETLIDGQASLVLCDDVNSPFGDGEETKEEAKCQQTAGKELSKYAAAVGKCLGKCRKNEFKGKTDGSCRAADCAAGGVPSGSCDTRTAECVTKATTKVLDKISGDQASHPKTKCPDGNPGSEPDYVPECVPGDSFDGFVATVAGLTGQVDQGTFCYSPSGAFVTGSTASLF